MTPSSNPASLRWPIPCARIARGLTGAACLALALAGLPAAATEFSVSPVTAELKPGALSETITITNHDTTNRLRVSIKVMHWTQDEKGTDVYEDSGDIIYFPRQVDIPPDSNRLVRIGAKAVLPPVERSYRLFIEEQPEPSAIAGRAQVNFALRFSIPVFVPPPQPKPVAEITESQLQNGKVSFTVRNVGNQHTRLLHVVVSGAAGQLQALPGTYLLPGHQKVYTATIPADQCRKAGTFDISVDGEGVRAERKLNVDPAHCV